MPLRRFTKNRAMVGVDIGSSAVKAVQLRRDRKAYTVTACAAQSLPPGVIADGAILDSAVVADVIRGVLASGTFDTDCVASLPGSAVIVKRLSLPAMSALELEEYIAWQTEDYVPFRREEVNVDYQVVSPSGAGDGSPSMNVVLVAARKKTIADYVAVLERAGRDVVAIDIDALALQNAYELNYGVDPAAVVALINAGASAINVNVVASGHSVFISDVSLGGHAFAEAIQREMQLPFDSAEKLAMGNRAEGIGPDEVRPILRTTTEQITDGLRKTFDFFRTVAPGTGRIDRVLLSGGAGHIDGFVQAVERCLGLPVERFDPFRRLQWDVRDCSAGMREQFASAAVVAVGLAARRAGGQ